jgi:hypothetical protein
MCRIIVLRLMQTSTSIVDLSNLTLVRQSRKRLAVLSVSVVVTARINHPGQLADTVTTCAHPLQKAILSGLV